MTRRLLGGAAALVVALALLVVAVTWFGGRDAAGGTQDAPDAPGAAAPARTQPELAAGNVVLEAAPGQLAGARRVADDLAGPASRALRQAGQAVIVRPASGGSGVVAVAWEHELRAASADAPAVGSFVDHWLGRGRAGS